MSSEDKIKKLLNVTGRLSRLVQQENEILAGDSRAAGLKDLLDEKKALSSIYEQQAKILEDEKALAEIDQNLRARLKDAIYSFNSLLEENGVRLAAKMEATKRVFEVIANAAKEYQNSATGYGKSGHMGNSIHKAYKPAVSVGLNQEF